MGAPRSGRRDLAACAAIMLAIVAARLALTGGPQFFNDAYQYLSISENIVTHHAVETSIVHFDEERSRHALPAPETTFPPGYPLLIAAFAWTHVDAGWLGFALSLLAGIAVLPLLFAASRALALGVAGTRVCLATWAFSAIASLFTITLYAEALFTCVALAAIVLLLRDLDPERAPSWRVPVALVVLGGSFWIRYAGLFFVAAAHLFAAAYIVRARARGAATWLASLAACDVVVGLLVARNLAVAGVWSGGNSRHVHVPAAVETKNFTAASYELAFGAMHHPDTPAFVAIFLAVAIGAFVIGRVAARTPAPRIELRRLANGRVALVATCAFGYLAALLYAGATTQISMSARMLLPILPLVGLLAGAAVDAAPGVLSGLLASRRTAALAALLPAAYVGANLAASLSRPPPPEHRRVESALASPVRSGLPLRAWLEANVPRDAVILATEGQATGHVLHRRTISVVGQAFTSLTWSEDEVRRIIDEFGVSYVIVYPEIVASGSSDHLSSRFLDELAAVHPPPWMEVAAANAHAVVYRPLRGGVSPSRPAVPANASSRGG